MSFRGYRPPAKVKRRKVLPLRKEGVWTGYRYAEFKKNRLTLTQPVCVKKHENLGKNAPKIEGAAGIHQFWNLSSTRGPLSPGAEIAPENPLGEEIWGVKFSSLPLNSPKMRGSRGANFAVFETSPRGLPAPKVSRF